MGERVFEPIPDRAKPMPLEGDADRRGKIFAIVVVILLILLAVIALLAYNQGRSDAENELIKRATIVINVENKWNSDQNVDIYINGEKAKTLRVSADDTDQATQKVSFMGSSQAYFHVSVQPEHGQDDEEIVMVVVGQTSFVDLEVG